MATQVVYPAGRAVSFNTGIGSATGRDLAQRFGVSETTIRAIRRYGQTWRPVK